MSAGVSEGEITLRPPRLDDAEAVTELFNRRARALYGTDDSAVDDVKRWWTMPATDPEQDARLAELASGEIVAYADVYDDAKLHTRFYFDLRQDSRPMPRAGERLVEWLERRARELASRAHPPVLARADVAAEDEAVRALFQAAGYRLVRHSFRMVAEVVGRELELPAWPEGVSVRTYGRETDEQRVYEVEQETFADMWEFHGELFEQWAHWRYGDDYDPTLWFLAEEGDELVGILLGRPTLAAEPDLGWISVLGVRRPWRRRGLALALLRHAFAEFQRRGRGRVGLGVDAQSLTGAVRLYERAGMGVNRRWELWEKELHP